MPQQVKEIIVDTIKKVVTKNNKVVWFVKDTVGNEYSTNLPSVAASLKEGESYQVIYQMNDFNGKIYTNILGVVGSEKTLDEVLGIESDDLGFDNASKAPIAESVWDKKDKLMARMNATNNAFAYVVSEMNNAALQGTTAVSNWKDLADQIYNYIMEVKK